MSLDRLGKTRQTGPRCPRCGAKPDCYDHQQQALSRRADIQICNRCGTEEALEDIAWGGQQKMHLADWAIVKGGWVECPMEGGRGVHHPARHYRQDPVRVLAAGAAGVHRPDLSEDHEQVCRAVRSDPVLPKPDHCFGRRSCGCS